MDWERTSRTDPCGTFISGSGVSFPFYENILLIPFDFLKRDGTYGTYCCFNELKHSFRQQGPQSLKGYIKQD